MGLFQEYNAQALEPELREQTCTASLHRPDSSAASRAKAPTRTVCRVRRQPDCQRLLTRAQERSTCATNVQCIAQRLQTNAGGRL